MTKQIAFGIIGCGYVAHRHAKYINASENASLIGVYDLDQQKAQEFAKQHNCVAYPNREALLNNSQIDILCICTPNGIHHEGAIAALTAGKHALVEKPMATSAAAARAMIAAAETAQKQLFVVKQNRFNPPVQAVKKLVQEGKVGQLFSVNINCFWNRNQEYYNQSPWRGSKQLDGGCLFTQYSHFVDIIYYLFGEIDVLAGVSQNFNHPQIEFEDCGHVLFKLKESGALGNLSLTISAFNENMEGSITLFAENATIKIGGRYLNTIDFQRTDGFDIEDLPISGPANNYGFYEGSMSNHDKVIHNVVETLFGREEIMTNAKEGLKVVEMIEEMYRHMRD